MSVTIIVIISNFALELADIFKPMTMNNFKLFSILVLFPFYLLADGIKSDAPISKPYKDKFMFLINSDPQMGDQFTEKSGLQVLNELLEMFVYETNSRKLKDKPDFVVWNGDLVWDAYQNAFDNFQRIVAKMKIPSVLVHGNHDGYDDDPKFLNLQENISGYRQLNYSFDYGKWHFVVISAQEKYNKDEQKKELLDWLDDDLRKNKDKQTMMFMHYHILPTGLSQMEFYTYFPVSFKNKLLDTITKYQNVKYVFSGHVHIGIKASIKTARTYKGTNFILAPTPVFARPFGEEYPKFDEKGSRYDKMGFYSEVHVNGDEVEIVGRKIYKTQKVKYPKKFKKFDENEDIRAFVPEGQLEYNEKLLNGDFSDGLNHWKSSWRYQKDKKPAFNNYVEDGKSILNYQAPYGSWTTDEYLENYQSVKYIENQLLNIQFTVSDSKHKGSGGYFRVFAYSKAGDLLGILLIHWGTQEYKVRFMPQSWAYNASGDRLGHLWLDQKLKLKEMLSFKINPDFKKINELDINLSSLFKEFGKSVNVSEINHLTMAYGVWGRVNQRGKKFARSLHVNKIQLNPVDDKSNLIPANVTLNNEPMTKEKELDFSYLYKSEEFKKRTGKRQ